MGGSTETTTVETGPLSPEGRSYQSLLNGMMMQNLADQGYEVTPSEKTVYQNQAKVDSINRQLTDYQKELDRLQAQIDKRTPEQQRAAAQWSRDPLQTQINHVNNQIHSLNNQLAKEKSTTYTDYQIVKKPSPIVQQAIDQYGADSPQAKQAQADETQAKVDQAMAMQNVQKAFLQNVQKYVNGDMSYTPEQAQQVEQYVGPIRTVINETAGKLLQQFGDDHQALMGQLDQLSTEIDKTGYAVKDALEAAQIQIAKNASAQFDMVEQNRQAVLSSAAQNRQNLLGTSAANQQALLEQAGQNRSSLLGVLQEVNRSTAARYKFEQDLMFQQVDRQAAQQAALLGLPPGSALEMQQRSAMRVAASTQLALQLNQREAEGAMGIEQQFGQQVMGIKQQAGSERLGIEQQFGETSLGAEQQAGLQRLGIESEAAQGKKQIAFSYIALAEALGAKKENVQGMAFDLMNQTFGKKQGVMAQQGAALLGLEQQKQSQLMNLAYGNIPNLINAATGAQAFTTGQQYQALQQQMAGMQPIASQLGVEQQRQFAETTTTVKKSPSFLDTFGSIVGMGAGAAGAAFSGGTSLAAMGTQNAMTQWIGRQP